MSFCHVTNMGVSTTEMNSNMWSVLTNSKSADFIISMLHQQPFSQKIVTILLTFSLKIVLRQFLSPFHKNYLTTNFNLTTKITLTIKNSSLGVLDTTLCDKVFLRQVNGFFRVLQFSPRIKLTDILLKGALNTINHLPQQPSFISIAQQSIFLNKIIL